MPIPKPKIGEGQDDFISRCMSDDVMNQEYPENEQRAGVCHTRWKTKELADIKDLFNEEYSEVSGLEIFNIYPNSQGIKFTEEDLEDMVENFNTLMKSGELEPNVKMSHSDAQLVLKELLKNKNIPFQEELPNLGFLKNVRKKGNSLFADIGNIPTALKGLLFDSKFFKSVSPEIVMDFKGTGRKVLRAIALTNIPSLKHIADVHMGEALRYGGNINLDEGGQNMADDGKKKKEDVKEPEISEGLITKLSDVIGEKVGEIFKKKEKDTKKKKEEPKKSDENVVSLADFEAMKEEFTESVNDLKLKLIKKDEEQKNFSDQVDKIKTHTRKETAKAICSTAMNDGVPKVVVELCNKILLSDIGEKTFKFSEEIDGEIVEADISLVNFVKKLFEVYPDKVDLSDKTVTELSAPSDDKRKKVNARVAELRKDGLSEHEALTRAGSEIL